MTGTLDGWMDGTAVAAVGERRSLRAEVSVVVVVALWLWSLQLNILYINNL